jgi:predicted aspartyl protease
MSMLWRALGMGLLLTLACATAAAADGCVPVRRARVPLTVEHRSLFVPMTLDGKAATFLLDTGAERTLVRAAAAARLGLKTEYASSHLVAGFGGTVASGEVHPQSVGLGGFAMSGFFALVADVSLAALAGQPADGLLGGDVLDGFDLDLDMTGRALTLYAPADCAAPVLPWDAPAEGTAAHTSLRRHLVFEVRIGGQMLPAFVDSGAQASFVDSAAAARLGVGAAELAGDPRITASGIGNSTGGLPLHRFAALEVADVTWPQPVLVVAPLHLDDADVILGADFLDAHRAWFSYRAGRIFFAPNG